MTGPCVAPRRALLLLVVALAWSVGPRALAAEGIVLVLHRVGTVGGVTYAPSAAALERQIASLRARGARFVTVSDLLSELATAEGLLVAVTFDDGDSSVHREALPVLRSLGVPATVFVIADRIGAPGHLTRAQLADLQAAGWEIGSHSARHAALGDLTPQGVRRELGDARAALAEALGTDDVCLAYPFGWHDGRVRAIVAEQHTCAVTTSPGLVVPGSDPLALPRPASSFLDGAGLDWRLDRGIDPLALTASAAAWAWLWPAPGNATAGGPTAAPPPAWHPATWRTLGHGRLELGASRTGATQAWALRDGAWSAQAWRAWGAPPGAAVSLARSLGDVTVAAAWVAGEGPGGGVAVDLAQHGEAWAWWTAGGGWRLGLEAVVLDGVRVAATWRPPSGDRAGRLTGELRAALPLWPEEGHPLSLALGHEDRPYARLAVRVGSHELGVALDDQGRTALGLLLRW